MGRPKSKLKAKEHKRSKKKKGEKRLVNCYQTIRNKLSTDQLRYDPERIRRPKSRTKEPKRSRRKNLINVIKKIGKKTKQ